MLLEKNPPRSHLRETKQIASAARPDPRQAVRLAPVIVPKPWGREVWHSAIEARGESHVLLGRGEMPLSGYLQAVGIEPPIVLLKQLDPHSAPVRGDLYFEVHGEKREIYVVTAVDAGAWPEGRGCIRFGMNQALRRRYGDDAAFRAAYLGAVRRYEQVRRAIDEDGLGRLLRVGTLGSRLRDDDGGHGGGRGSDVGLESAFGLGGGAQVGDEVDRRGRHIQGQAGRGDCEDDAELGGSELEPLHEEERWRRAAMEEFTAMAELAVGDVVVVPPWTPHALQHGVRVIEFQTPVYERYIISFAQKVVAQDHWDTEVAVARMNLDPPPQPRFKQVARGIERIASFPDFGVWRASLRPGRSVSLPPQAPYALCMAVDGPVQVGELRLQPEEACLVPAGGLAGHRLQVQAVASCLVAAPGL